MPNPSHSETIRNFAVRNRVALWLGQALVLVAIGFAAAWMLKPATSDSGAGADGHAQHAEATKIWTCAMHPQIRRDRPGDCPICGMDLVPVTPSAGGMRTITISPAARKLMRIETTPVERRYVNADVRMVGKIEYDETRLSHITAWVSGRLDRLFVNYPGIQVEKGHHLVYIFSEQLYAAQEELIQAIKHQRNRPPATTTLIEPIDLAESAREKLRLLGLTAEQIEEIVQRGTPTDHITIYSPIAGIVIEKLREEGDRVRTGDRIYTVADLTQVWVKLDAYESDLQWLRYGQEVEFTTEAYPGETFKGQIAFIDPVLNKDTRTVKVRVNVRNDALRLKPEMFVRAVVHSRVAAGGRVLDASLAGKWISPMHPEIVRDEPGTCDVCGMPLVRSESLGYITGTPDADAKPLVIPVSSALVTGTRAIVYVEVPTAEEPTFEGREIVLGPRAGEYYLVRHGLKEGELVVTQGNFKLDSALQISAKPSMMTPEGGGGGGHDHGGTGEKSPGQQDHANHEQAADIPSQFRSQLDQLVLAFSTVDAAIEEADLDEIRAAFDAAGEALSQVDAKLIAGHSAMVWRELSMLLSNDVAEGQDVATIQDADRVVLQLRRHVERVQEQFGMKSREDEPGIVRFDTPPAFQSQLSLVMTVYFALHDSLAQDNAQLALQSASGLRVALADIDTTGLSGEALVFWKRELANLNKIAERIMAAKDVDSLREAFSLLSDELLVVVKAFPSETGPQLYELHCSMAFNRRGASWIQDAKQPRNPYYGAAMLPCADRVTLISPKQLPAAEKQQHDHQHP